MIRIHWAAIVALVLVNSVLSGVVWSGKLDFLFHPPREEGALPSFKMMLRRDGDGVVLTFPKNGTEIRLGRHEAETFTETLAHMIGWDAVPVRAGKSHPL